VDEFADLDDGQLIDRAREIYRACQRVPRWHEDNDKLIRQWGAVCREMGARGMNDSVCEGERPGAAAFRLITG
jgi:hypothetical protein